TRNKNGVPVKFDCRSCPLDCTAMPASDSQKQRLMTGHIHRQMLQPRLAANAQPIREAVQLMIQNHRIDKEQRNETTSEFGIRDDYRRGMPCDARLGGPFLIHHRQRRWATRSALAK